MNCRWSNICVLQFLLVLHANALKLVPAEKTIVRTNGSTRTISKYYLLPQDGDDPYDPAGSALSSDNEDFAEFLREFRAKKAAEQNPKKKVDKYKIYIKRKLKHKAPEKPKNGPNGSATTTDGLKPHVTTEKYKIPIKITELKIPVTTTEGNKFRITSETPKPDTTTTEYSKPIETTETTTVPIITKIITIPVTEITANPVTNNPAENEDTTTTETPITVYTTIITTIHNANEPSTATEANSGQTPQHTSEKTPEDDGENSDKPKDLLQIPHVHYFGSNEAERNQTKGTRPEKVIKHVETDGFIGDLTKIVSDEDQDVNKTTVDTDESKSNNTLNNEKPLGIQYPYGDSKENRTKLDEEFQKLLQLLKEPTKNISFADTPNWKPYDGQMPILTDGIVFIDDSSKTSALKIPGQMNHHTSDNIDQIATSTLLASDQEGNYPSNLNLLWSQLISDEHNSSHQHQLNTTYIHEHSNLFEAQLHSAEILKNITSALSNSHYTQLPSADYSKVHSVTTVYPETTKPAKYTDNTQSDLPQIETNTDFTDYTKSGSMDFSQNETNATSADNIQSTNPYSSQIQLNSFNTDYTQSVNADLSQAGLNSNYTEYVESANNNNLHTGTDMTNAKFTQSENINHLIDLSPHYGGYLHSDSNNLSQKGLNLDYTNNVQSGSKDFTQAETNSQSGIQSSNIDALDFAAIQSANQLYSQTESYPQYADYTQTGSNSAYTDYSHLLNSDLSQTQSNANYADYTQSANTDYAHGSSVEFTGYTQSVSANYSQSGTSSTFIDYTQAGSFSESHAHPLFTDYIQLANKDFSQTDTNLGHTGNAQSANMDYIQTGTNSAYTDHAYTETDTNPNYAHYIESVSMNSHKRKPHLFGHRHILHNPNFQTSRKVFKAQNANKIRDRPHKNKWIAYKEYNKDPNQKINNNLVHVDTEVENGDINNPSPTQINNYIQLARVCPLCITTLYNELQKKELIERLNPNDAAMVRLFQKILLYSYIQSQNQQGQSDRGSLDGRFQKHPDVTESQSKFQPIQTLPSDSLQNDPGAINLQIQNQHDSTISPKRIPQIRPSSMGVQNQQTQSQQKIPNHHVHVDTIETMLKDETESLSKAHMTHIPKIQLFDEENLSKVLSAIVAHRKTQRDKYSFKLYSLLKVLLDVGKAYTSNGNDVSWYSVLPTSTRNSILSYLRHLVQQPWLQELMLQLYKNNNNLDILRNPKWRHRLAAWRIPKGLLNPDVGSDDLDINYNDDNDHFQDITVSTQDDGSAILDILKSYIRSPEFNSSVGSAQYYEKQNKILGQVVVYLKRKGYAMDFIEILINELHGTLNRHVRKVEPRHIGTEEFSDYFV